MKKAVQSAICALFLSPAFGQWVDQDSGIQNDLESVYFVSQNEGWAVGRQGKIIHTTNGGTTWTQQNSGTTKDLNKVHMLNATFGVAVGDQGTAVKYNGTTWTTITSGTSQDLYSVYFTDVNTGWIAGDYAIIKKTTNGGASFTAESTTSLASTFYDIKMTSATEGWAVGSTGNVWKYNGSGWNNVTTPYTGTGTGPDLYSVSFSSADNGFATGRASSIIYFDGTSWTTQGTTLPDNTYRIHGVHTLNDNLAYAASSPGLGGAGYILKFNGSVWTTDYSYSGIDSELFKAVHFPTASKGYVVGYGGIVKSKTTGGSTASIGENEGNIALNVYPNPFDAQATLSYALESAGEVSVGIYDINGKLLHSELLQRSAGNHEHKIDGTTLSTGVYYLRVSTSTGTATTMLLK